MRCGRGSTWRASILPLLIIRGRETSKGFRSANLALDTLLETPRPGINESPRRLQKVGCDLASGPFRGPASCPLESPPFAPFHRTLSWRLFPRGAVFDSLQPTPEWRFVSADSTYPPLRLLRILIWPPTESSTLEDNFSLLDSLWIPRFNVLSDIFSFPIFLFRV